MEYFDVQYWHGRGPTEEQDAVCCFKGLTGHEHKVLLFHENPETIRFVRSIYEERLVFQRDFFFRDCRGRRLRPGEPEDVLKWARMKGWSAYVCAVVECYKIIKIEAKSMAELIADAILTLKPEYSWIGLGLGKDEFDIYLARECDESEARKLNQQGDDAAKHGKSHPGDEGQSGNGEQPSGEVDGSEGLGETSEGGQQGLKEEHRGKGHSGRGRSGRDSGAKPPSVADAFRTVNAGHWQRSKGPWAFGGVANANGPAGREDGRSTRGGRQARGRYGEDSGRSGPPWDVYGEDARGAPPPWARYGRSDLPPWVRRDGRRELGGRGW